jgi:hypothetical protein
LTIQKEVVLNILKLRTLESGAKKFKEREKKVKE